MTTWGFTENSIFRRRGVQEKPILGRGCLKGGLEQFANLREGDLAKKRGWYFWGGGIDTPVHTMNIFAAKFNINNFTFNSFIDI